VEKKQFIDELSQNDAVTSPFLVKEKRLATTRSGKPYLSLRLGDRSGEIEGRIWEQATELDSAFDVNDVVLVQGRVERYREQLQLKVTAIERLDPEDIEADLFLPTSPVDSEELWQQLKAIAAQVRNRHLQRLLQHFLTAPDFARQMKKAPAAKSMHHAYAGGLLEHTVSVTKLLESFCEHYPFLDRDLLITAGILHDIGKLEELSGNLAIDYTDAGRLLGHLVLGAQRVAQEIDKIANFPTDLALSLQHLIVSHHGEYEFGSPKRPKIIEAFALHYADDLDARMNNISSVLAATTSRWTTFQRQYGRFLFKGGNSSQAAALETSRSALEVRPREKSANYSLLERLSSISEGKEP